MMALAILTLVVLTPVPSWSALVAMKYVCGTTCLAGEIGMCLLSQPSGVMMTDVCVGRPTEGPTDRLMRAMGTMDTCMGRPTDRSTDEYGRHAHGRTNHGRTNRGTMDTCVCTDRWDDGDDGCVCGQTDELRDRPTKRQGCWIHAWADRIKCPLLYITMGFFVLLFLPVFFFASLAFL